MSEDPARYLEYLRLQTSWIEKDGRRIAIEDGYVPLTADGEDLEAALAYPRLLIIGAPGAGKTTFLRHVAYLWTCGIEDTRTRTLMLPFFFPLAEMPQARSPEALVDDLNRRNRELDWGLSAEFFAERLRQGAGILLFDGLDEAPEAASLIEDAAARWQACRFVVTARPAAASCLPSFRRVRIEP